MISPPTHSAVKTRFPGKGRCQRGPRAFLTSVGSSTTQTSGREVPSRKRQGHLDGSLTLCRAGMAMGGQPSGVVPKPMRGGTVEARDRDRRGQHLEGETPREDRLTDNRVTPARGNGPTGCSHP
jgi:hypothetical protein